MSDPRRRTLQTSSAHALADAPLVLVSNRGPITYDLDADGKRFEKRGTGGLVTALTGLVNHRTDTLWVASAMTDEDAVVSAEHEHTSPSPSAPRRTPSTASGWSAATPTPTTASTT